MCIIMWGLAAEVDDRRIDCAADLLRNQLVEYERGERRESDVDVRFPDFSTGDVMHVAASIPYGETRTHDEVATELDSHAVAVGQACGRNPAPLVVPCHRIVGAGSLGGSPVANGVDLKRALFDHERGVVQMGPDRFD